MARGLTVVLLALALVPGALADPKTVKPDRAAIDKLLDEFVPDVVEGVTSFLERRPPRFAPLAG